MVDFEQVNAGWIITFPLLLIHLSNSNISDKNTPF